jgi:mercuric reductase
MVLIRKSDVYTWGEFVLVTGPGQLRADRLLVAAGRSASTGALVLAAANVTVDAENRIIIDPAMRCST